MSALDPINQLHLPSTAARSSGYIPDLRDRGACARFRLRKKAMSSSRRSSTHTPRNTPKISTNCLSTCVSLVSQLQGSVLNLHREVEDISRLLLQQAQHLDATMHAVQATQNMLLAFMALSSKFAMVPAVLPVPAPSEVSRPLSPNPCPSAASSRNDGHLSLKVPPVPVSPLVSIPDSASASRSTSSAHQDDDMRCTPLLDRPTSRPSSSFASAFPGLRGRYVGRKQQAARPD
jgi:hypothetical protein